MEFNIPINKRGRRGWPSGSLDMAAIKAATEKNVKEALPETPQKPRIIVEVTHNSAVVLFQASLKITPPLHQQLQENTAPEQPL